MNIENTKEQAAKLREEAKDLLDSIIGLPPMVRSKTAERFVDCIIEVIMLEISLKRKE